MTVTTDRPAILTPTQDRRPVEMAAVDGIADLHEPETFLWIVFHLPNGGVRTWYAWTQGGQPLGDRTDQAALTKGLDACDWLHITDRHSTYTIRGRIHVQAHPLRPILADVQAGVRGPEGWRDALRRLAADAAHQTGQPTHTLTPPWLGVGPALLARCAR